MRAKNSVVTLALLVPLLLLTSCGGGGGGDSGGSATTYSIGGTIYGLTGAGLVLQNNGGDNLSVTVSGSRTFTTQLPTNSTYSVMVLTQPSGQTCTVTNGDGTVSNANVTNISVSCGIRSYSIGATIYGLTGAGLVLQNNGGDNLSVTASGSRTFTTQLPTNTTYSVTIFTQPGGQICTVTNGNGTVSAANVSNISVNCSTTPPLSCAGGNGNGTNGIRLYNPSNFFTYQLSTTIANAPDIAMLGWGAAYTGTLYGAYTGSLLANLWAVSSSYSGGAIYGHVLGDFNPNFTGAGAYSSSQLLSGGYSTNTIVSSSSKYNPPAGQYCLVITLSHYEPGMCTPSPNGYCIVDWLQFSGPVNFN